jgi:hypothetical protein
MASFKTLDEMIPLHSNVEQRRSCSADKYSPQDSTSSFIFESQWQSTDSSTSNTFSGSQLASLKRCANGRMTSEMSSTIRTPDIPYIDRPSAIDIEENHGDLPLGDERYENLCDLIFSPPGPDMTYVSLC